MICKQRDWGRGPSLTQPSTSDLAASRKKSVSVLVRRDVCDV